MSQEIEREPVPFPNPLAPVPPGPAFQAPPQVPPPPMQQPVAAVTHDGITHPVGPIPGAPANHHPESRLAYGPGPVQVPNDVTSAAQAAAETAAHLAGNALQRTALASLGYGLTGLQVRSSGRPQLSSDDLLAIIQQAQAMPYDRLMVGAGLVSRR